MNSAAVKLAHSGKGSRGPRPPVVVGGIADDVPLPAPPVRGRARAELKFGELLVGQSFAVSGVSKLTLAKHAKNYDAEFLIDFDPKGEGEFRVWRTA